MKRGQVTCECLSHGNCVRWINVPSGMVADHRDHVVVRKVGGIVAWLIDSCKFLLVNENLSSQHVMPTYTVVILDGQVLLVVLVAVPSSQATSPGVVFC